ncbi:MAG: type IV pilus biogenesis/stability protein PilW [Gammaproteobacteria bacterium]|nr:MAG: type IV pilus biogenesis/stability protein PilW [Gammaproteobacteria bacterium]
MNRRLPGLLLVAALLAGCAAQPVDERARQAAEINTDLGIRYMQHGMKAVALEKLQKALREDPGYARAHGAIAVLYEQLGEMDEADRHFRQAIRLAPKDPSTLNNYGGFLCRRGKVDAAIAQFRKAAAHPLYDRPALALANAGVCAYRAGRLRQSERLFRAALEKDPRQPAALFHMARLMLDRQDYLRARAYVQRLLEVTGPRPDVLWMGIQVERALGDRDAVASYALLLRHRFPNSPEARRLKALDADGGQER